MTEVGEGGERDLKVFGERWVDGPATGRRNEARSWVVYVCGYFVMIMIMIMIIWI